MLGVAGSPSADVWRPHHRRPMPAGRSPPPLSQVRWQVMGTWHALRLTSLTVVGVTAGPHEAAAGPLGAVPPGARSGGHHPLAAFLEAGCASTLERLVLVSGGQSYATAPPEITYQWYQPLCPGRQHGGQPCSVKHGRPPAPRPRSARASPTMAQHGHLHLPRVTRGRCPSRPAPLSRRRSRRARQRHCGTWTCLAALRPLTRAWRR